MGEHEVKDLENAKHQLEQFNKIHTIMTYTSDLCDRSTLILYREDANNHTQPLSVYRASKHNEIEKLIPEVEAVIHSYYDLVDQLEGYPEWQFKIQEEAGSQIGKPHIKKYLIVL